jgi:hypothetical protein
MKAADYDDSAMTTWHQKFEEHEPEEDPKFLESLDIDTAGLKRSRKTIKRRNLRDEIAP